MENKDLEVVIGLEVHIQLATRSKLFCSCSTQFESPPNTNICPICCGYPGVLPVLNRRALELAIRVCLALKCGINRRIYFERKNYFYPDLPKNYQISQYKLPLGEKGVVELSGGEKIRIERVHLEEDAGKLIHQEKYSLVDFNRAGVPLLEIVSYPDIRSPLQAFNYLTQLKLIVQYIEASSCDMEKGSLRCDANISVRRKGEKKLGTKVELKNMNTFRGVRDALEYEARRQIALLEREEKVLQQTRLWDDKKKCTFSMRSKEQAHDYRYFPEPDLVDFVINEEMLRKEEDCIGELPLAKKKRLLKEYNLGEKEVEVLVSHPKLANFFEECCKFYNKPKKISNWLIGVFLEIVNSLGEGFNKVKISPSQFSKVVSYFCEGKLNNLAAKKTLELTVPTGENVDKVIEREGLTQVSQEGELNIYVKEVIRENPKPINDYLKGKKEAIMFLVGQVMRKTKGRANPRVVRELLYKEIADRNF